MKCVNDSARKLKLRGKQVIVPHKFDRNGNPVTKETPRKDWLLSRLNQNDLAFLSIWKEMGYSKSVDEVSAKTNISVDEAKRLIRKLAWREDEDKRIEALAKIPTVSYIKAQHVISLHSPIEEKLCDSDQKSLSELAKIEGAYKNTNQVNIQNNFFAKPQMTPEQEEATRKFFDTIAVDAIASEDSNAA